jgi:hypothetical protein
MDYKESGVEEFCDINGDCTSNSDYVQSETYAPFIVRTSPKIGSFIDLGNAKLSISTGLRADLTPF